MSRIVIAPDSFKGSIMAADAAAALADGWRRVRPDDEIVLRPLADGGEGTLDAFAAAVPDAVRHPVRVHGPAGAEVDAEWLALPDGTAVVELASTSGIILMPTLAPLDAHTLGFGEAIAAALDGGCQRLVVALGSSSSTDGGLGALSALGLRATDAANRPVRLGARGLGSVARVDASGLRALPPGGAVILGDVTNPLLGPRGAAAVFGPQKGATPAMVEAFDENLARWARLLARAPMPGRVDPTAAGAGAAGGTGFGLLAWGATMAGGAAAVADAIGLSAALEGADLVITGEGRFDDQSLDGKVPSLVLERADAASVPVALVAGVVTAETTPFSAAVALADLAGSAEAARAEPARWLAEAGARLGAASSS